MMTCADLHGNAQKDRIKSRFGNNVGILGHYGVDTTLLNTPLSALGSNVLDQFKVDSKEIAETLKGAIDFGKDGKP